jgi:hypothetical protein
MYMYKHLYIMCTDVYVYVYLNAYIKDIQNSIDIMNLYIHIKIICVFIDMYIDMFIYMDT